MTRLGFARSRVKNSLKTRLIISGFGIYYSRGFHVQVYLARGSQVTTSVRIQIDIEPEFSVSFYDTCQKLVLKKSIFIVLRSSEYRVIRKV